MSGFILEKRRYKNEERTLVVSTWFTIGIFGGYSEDKNVSTGDSFAYWLQMDVNVSQTQNSFNDLLMYKEIEKAIGTKVEFIHPSKGTIGSKAFQILMALDDYNELLKINHAAC